MQRLSQPTIATVVVLLATVILHLWVAIFGPPLFWGIGIWRSISLPAALVSLIIATTVVGLITLVMKTPARQSQRLDTLGLSLILCLICCALFVLFRGRTYFLGDGLSLISNLNSGEPIVKWWEPLGMLPQIVLKRIFFNGKGGSLLSYQAVSVISGLTLLIVTIYLSGRLGFSTKQRILLSALLFSAGFSLQFYGYVENYAILISALACFTLSGMMFIGSGRGLWVSILSMIIAVACHAIGLFLIPAMILLVADRCKVSRFTKLCCIYLLPAIMVLSPFILLWFYSPSRFLLLPFVANRFSEDGYALLSFRHIFDLCNLVLFVAPGILLTMPLFVNLKASFLSGAEREFVIMSTCIPLVFAIFADPRLGMPRDWDLFSCTLVPGTTALAVLLVRASQKHGLRLLQLNLILFVNCSCLGAKVYCSAVPEFGLNQAIELSRLDVRKSGPIRNELIHYLKQSGDEERANLEIDAARRDYPEIEVAKKATILLTHGQFSEAAFHFERAIELSPRYFAAWLNYGICLEDLKMHDSALTVFQVAYDLRPTSIDVLLNMAASMRSKGEWGRAAAEWKAVLRRDSANRGALIGLIEYYARLGDANECRGYLYRYPDTSVLPFDSVDSWYRRILDSVRQAGTGNPNIGE